MAIDFSEQILAQFVVFKGGAVYAKTTLSASHIQVTFNKATEAAGSFLLL